MRQYAEHSTGAQGVQTHQQRGLPSPALVLVVDDDETLRELLEKALTIAGYQVLTTASVLEAEMVKQCYSAADLGLVISDIHLTATSRAWEGYELYQRWIAVEPTLPFLLISGDPCSRILPAIQTGAVRFLDKPFSVQTFLSTVQTLLRVAGA
jgi:DNA-binding NtrC family response regulator